MLCVALAVVALSRLAAGDVSCEAACARCGPRPADELAAVYCALCGECRARRRDWLQTAGPARRSVASVHRPDLYREEAYYKKDATVWNAANAGYIPVSGCPPPPPCADGGQFAYVKVYGLQGASCPPAPACVTAAPTHAPRSRRTKPRSRRTRPPSVATPAYCCANQCCPVFTPMMPLSCMCPFGAMAPGIPPVLGAGVPPLFGPGGLAALHGGGVLGLSTITLLVGKTASDSQSSTTQATSSSRTEPVYLYIGIPKVMQKVVDTQP